MLPPPESLVLQPSGVAPVATDAFLAAPALTMAALAVAPAALVLYRRIARRDVFVSPTRERVYRAFAAAPGATVAHVAGTQGLDYGTVEHHARVLTRLHLLEAQRDGCRIRYFVPGTLPPAARERAILAHTPGAQRVYDAIAAGRARTRAEVAARTGLSRSTVRWHVDRLLARGLIQAEQTPQGTTRLRARRHSERVVETPGGGNPPQPASRAHAAADDEAGTERAQS